MDSELTHVQRQRKLSSQLEGDNIGALILNPGPTLTYLTGLSFHLMERPILAIFTPHHPPHIVLPKLEAAKLIAIPYPAESTTYGEDPSTWNPIFSRVLQEADFQDQFVAIEPTRLRVLEYRLLEQVIPSNKILGKDEIIARLRMLKDDNEIVAMRKVVSIAQEALERVRSLIAPGMTEKQIANQLTLELIRAGSDPQFPFTPIVSAGPNSANPHASPTNRMITPGDLLVIDWGASFNGYISDITRTFAIGDVDNKLKLIADLVEQANQSGISVIKPGIPASHVDQAAREVIEQAGYGQYFVHRTGHGIGMEGHEPPYIRGDNSRILQPGMTFTVEPGIYLPGRGGVRIEDDVCVTDDGAEVFSSLPRELITIEV